ncbi:MAG: AI-2E family transporter [Ignavibacteria bacterium]|nr:AI-2E family transporter [Ignavibacteria bacterium]
MKEKNKALTIIAVIAIIIFAYVVLSTLKSILIPFFIAIILSFIFEPLYDFLKNKKIPGFVAIILILLIIVAVANITSLFIFTSVNTFSADLPKYEEKFRNLINTLYNFLRLSDEDISKMHESLNLKNLLMQGSITGFLTSLFTSILGIFGDFVLILIYVVFLLSEMGSIRQRIKNAYNVEKAYKISEILNEIFADVKKYLVGKTLINFIQAVIFGFILWAFGVDFYIVWAFLCFFSHYVPNIGSLISTILPGLIAVLQFDNLITPVIIIILLIIVQNVIGNILEPKYLGDQLDLSPLLLLFSLIFWGYVWGIVGMVLSVPIMSIIKITLSKFESTRSVAVLMSYDKESGREITSKIKAITKRKSKSP